MAIHSRLRLPGWLNIGKHFSKHPYMSRESWSSFEGKFLKANELKTSHPSGPDLWGLTNSKNVLKASFLSSWCKNHGFFLVAQICSKTTLSLAPTLQALLFWPTCKFSKSLHPTVCSQLSL
jgi:hypothetical protein